MSQRTRLSMRINIKLYLCLNDSLTSALIELMHDAVDCYYYYNKTKFKKCNETASTGCHKINDGLTIESDTLRSARNLYS